MIDQEANVSQIRIVQSTFLDDLVEHACNVGSGIVDDRTTCDPAPPFGLFSANLEAV